MTDNPLSENHWRIEGFKQRMSHADWGLVLLGGYDTMVFRGEIRKLQAVDIGYGVVEVSKAAKESGS